jgi:hypothetical protein
MQGGSEAGSWRIFLSVLTPRFRLRACFRAIAGFIESYFLHCISSIRRIDRNQFNFAQTHSQPAFAGDFQSLDF